MHALLIPAHSILFRLHAVHDWFLLQRCILISLSAIRIRLHTRASRRDDQRLSRSFERFCERINGGGVDSEDFSIVHGEIMDESAVDDDVGFRALLAEN